MKTGTEHCAFCLEPKAGRVCVPCCEDRHTLVKRELDELKAVQLRLVKALEGLGYSILPRVEK